MEHNELVKRFMELKERKEVLDKQKMSYGVKVDSLESSLKTSMGKLKEKYDVDSIQEAKALLESTKQEIETTLESAETKLKTYEDLLSE